MKKTFDTWKNHPSLDPSLKKAMETMSESDIEDAFYKPLAFGTGGMRGKMGPGTNRINVHTLRKAAYGFAKYVVEHETDAQRRGIVIAYDNREHSDAFAWAAAEVIAAFGMRAFVFEHMRPTPLLSFAVRHQGAAGGIVITASHNPPEYNGFKIYDADGCQLVPNHADKVVRNVEAVEDVFKVPAMDIDEAKAKGLITELGRDIDESYLEQIATVPIQPADKKQLTVVFTPLHGASREIGLRALTEAGYHVVTVEEQMVPDSQFKTVKSPNPEDEAAFELAIKYAREHRADLLIATDPDGDRLGLGVLHEGNYEFLTGNQTGAIFIEHMLESHKQAGTLPDHGIIYNTIVTSDFGAAIARTYGVDVESTLTGFKFIGERMKAIEQTKHTFLMGYEESYGYIIKDFVRDKDAIQAMIYAADIADRLKKQGKTLIDYLHELYAKYGTYREKNVNLTLEGKAGEARIEAIMEHFREWMPTRVAGHNLIVKEDYLRRLRYERGVEHIIDLPASNVIKFAFDDEAWFVLRPSGTEPKLKIYIAAKAPRITEADTTLKALEEAIMAIIDDVPEADQHKEVKR